MSKSIRTILFSVLLAAPIALSSALPGVAQTSEAAVSADWSNFMFPQDVSAAVNENTSVQIIDIRRAKYVHKGTIPGAVWLPFNDWRGTKERDRQPLRSAELAAFVGDAGITLDQPIVVFEHSGKPVQTGRAAIVYWILKSAGAEDITIMNGGFDAWSAAELPHAEEPVVLDPISIEVTYSQAHWADSLDVFAVTTGQKRGAILGACLDGPVRKSMETVVSSMNMPMTQYMPASVFTSQSTAENLSAPAKGEFREALEARGIPLGDGMLISVCETDELSALSWFYASEIVGIENVRYYPDAMRGWEGNSSLMLGMRASL